MRHFLIALALLGATCAFTAENAKITYLCSYDLPSSETTRPDSFMKLLEQGKIVAIYNERAFEIVQEKNGVARVVSLSSENNALFLSITFCTLEKDPKKDINYLSVTGTMRTLFDPATGTVDNNITVTEVAVGSQYNVQHLPPGYTFDRFKNAINALVKQTTEDLRMNEVWKEVSARQKEAFEKGKKHAAKQAVANRKIDQTALLLLKHFDKRPTATPTKGKK